LVCVRSAPYPEKNMPQIAEMTDLRDAQPRTPVNQ
jgi:hypothetical protein